MNKTINLFNPAVVGLIISNELNLGKKCILTPQDLLYFVYLVNYQMRQNKIGSSVRCPINNSALEGNNVGQIKKEWPIVDYIRRTHFQGSKYYNAIDRLDNFKGTNLKIEDKSLNEILNVYNGIVKNDAKIMIDLDRDYRNIDDATSQQIVAMEVYKCWRNSEDLQKSKIVNKLLFNKTLNQIAKNISSQDKTISEQTAKAVLRKSLELFDKSQISEVNLGFFSGYYGKELDYRFLGNDHVVSGYMIGHDSPEEERSK